MILARRMLLLSFVAAWLGMIVACGGGGRQGDSDAQAVVKTSEHLPHDSTGKLTTEAHRQRNAQADKLKEEANERHRREELEQSEQEAKDLGRRDELRKILPVEEALQVKEEAAYRLAKAEFEAVRKLKQVRRFAKVGTEERLKGNAKEADRLSRVAHDGYEDIVEKFPGTLAAGDAKELIEERQVPDRVIPADPDDPNTIRGERLSKLERCLDLAAIGDWGSTLQQIPATVIDKGVLKYVPYQSFRAGDYELNIYGDPEFPACVEIGVYKTLLNNSSATARCRTFMASLLTDPGDRYLLKSLKLTQDLQKRGGLTLEVTPETAEDAYGGWWISVYDLTALDRSRASPQEIAAITVPKEPPQAPAAGPAPSWSPDQMTLARPGAKSVNVHSYTRKDGTYVQAYMRAAPGAGTGRKR